jgi:hypothetical protein
MKMTPQLRKAQENMAPGVISASGFLGSDTRPLGDIIEADERDMTGEGMSFEETARAMRDLMEQGRRGLGEPTTVRGTWLVRVDEARGMIASPFGGEPAQKVTVQVYRADRDVTVSYSALSIALLERHHFLQGRGSPYRLEPAMLKAVLF